VFILHLGVISRERLSGLELVKEYLKHKQEEEVCIIIERMSGLDLLKEYLKHSCDIQQKFMVSKYFC
jgi:hypothetical protein